MSKFCILLPKFWTNNRKILPIPLSLRQIFRQKIEKWNVFCRVLCEGSLRVFRFLPNFLIKFFSSLGFLVLGQSWRLGRVLYVWSSRPCLIWEQMRRVGRAQVKKAEQGSKKQRTGQMRQRKAHPHECREAIRKFVPKFPQNTEILIAQEFFSRNLENVKNLRSARK